MSMTAGSVTVADDESVTGTGLARARYDADVASMAAATPPILPPLPVLHGTTAPYSAARPVTSADIALAQAGRLRILREAARRATASASADVAYLQANATTTVGGIAYPLD